jgi:hypothetical protein
MLALPSSRTGAECKEPTGPIKPSKTPPAVVLASIPINIFSCPDQGHLDPILGKTANVSTPAFTTPTKTTVDKENSCNQSNIESSPDTPSEDDLNPDTLKSFKAFMAGLDVPLKEATATPPPSPTAAATTTYLNHSTPSPIKRYVDTSPYKRYVNSWDSSNVAEFRRLYLS